MGDITENFVILYRFCNLKISNERARHIIIRGGDLGIIAHRLRKPFVAGRFEYDRYFFSKNRTLISTTKLRFINIFKIAIILCVECC